MTRRKPPARFITLEGGEGAGKSTQARRLAESLKTRGVPCITTREPGGSPGAEEIRRLLVHGRTDRWDPLTETMLMFAARSDHIVHTIRPALAAGTWVICDRFTDSTHAYQGAGRGVPRETIRRIQSLVLEGFEPDLTLILDLPPEAGLARAGRRRQSEKRFEGFDLAFHQRLRAAFLAAAKRAPGRCRVINASGGEEEVATAIFAAVRTKFRLK